MVTIILALCIPVTAAVTGLFVFKGYELGLKVNQHTPTNINSKSTPDVSVQKELGESDNHTQQALKKQMLEQSQIVNEWLYGDAEGR